MDGFHLKIRRLKTAAFLLLAMLPFGTVQAEEVTPFRLGSSGSDYDDLRDLALTIVRQYPPDRFYYLGIGQSPTPIIAILQNLSLPASSIPLSGIESHERNAFGGADAASQANKDLLYRHFEAMLPSAEKVGERQILAIDIAATGSGKGIAAAKRILSTFSAETGKKYGVRSVALSVSYLGPEYRQSIDDEIKLSPFKWAKAKLFGSQYKQSSEYGKFFLSAESRGSEYAPPKRLPRYDQLKSVLSQFMADDSPLHQIVRSWKLCNYPFK